MTILDTTVALAEAAEAILVMRRQEVREAKETMEVLIMVPHSTVLAVAEALELLEVVRLERLLELEETAQLIQ